MNDFPEVIAHRGVFHNPDVPENSLLAFQKAISKKLAFELDIQLTKDNVLVVFHDKSLKRMTGVSKVLENVSYDELKNYTLLGTKEKIPTLKEVLSLNQDTVFIDIEVKNTKRYKKLCEILQKELENYHSYSLKSFNPRIVRYLKKQFPMVQVGYLIQNHYQKKRYSFFLPSLWMIHYSKADFLSIQKDLFIHKKYQKLHRKYPMSLWTIEKSNEIQKDNVSYICNCKL